MLKLLRNQKLAKKIFYVLAIVIVPSFVFWGSATVIKDRRLKGYAGKIFGKSISYDEYRNALHAWRNQLKMKFGDKASQIESIFDANQAVWDKLILRYGTKKMKIKVTNEELTQHITSLPFLQKDGAFDAELYNLFLRYSLNTPVRIFEEDMRETLKFQKLFNQLTKDVAVSEEEIKERYKQENEQIKLKYINALNQDLEKEVNLSNEELKSRYEETKESLKISIQADLAYIGRDYPRNATDEQKEDINNEVEKISNFIKEGNSLIKAGEEFKLQIHKTGFISLGDPLLDIDWPPEDLVKLFNLAENETTEAIHTQRGPYIFELKEKRINYLPTFEEAEEKVKDSLIKEKSKELAKSKIDNYHTQLTTKKQENPNLEFTKIAKSLSIPIKETEFFNMYSSVPNIGFSQDFNEAAFNLTDNQISKVIELPQGYFILIKVTERKPIDETEFEKSKEDLKNTLLSEKKNQTFEEFFAKLRQKANLIDHAGMQQNQLPAAVN